MQHDRILIQKYWECDKVQWLQNCKIIRFNLSSDTNLKPYIRISLSLIIHTIIFFYISFAFIHFQTNGWMLSAHLLKTLKQRGFYIKRPPTAIFLKGYADYPYTRHNPKSSFYIHPHIWITHRTYLIQFFLTRLLIYL